ncbi:hypothetical protein GWO43_05530 [candidate division KSB1 bacterium]|nr:hypothetical protein [candidate division KSB1 bacterium]NIR71611.1 hypothetical protein [candidate division KSB1 bacterium]NIS23446.1 hypothetical protein [candidate division KSB1 bacterium]NIT70354.1 hypothetical protein [candidate division KSB1 bacterium]NIU24056.1 hypothetical protein [candidate division KSB1 bacterium]
MRKTYLFCLLSLFLVMSCSGDDESSSQTIQTSANHEDSTQVKSTSETQFAIQVAAFYERQNAEKLKTQLLQTDLPAYVSSNSSEEQGTIYRIRVGPFLTRKQADEFLTEVRESGYSEAFVLIETEPPETPAATTSTKDTLDTLEIQKKQLTSENTCSFPSWSPNGREIAFFKSENGVSGIYTVGTGGGYASKIIVSDDRREVLSTFAWSPSADKIAFVAREIADNWEYVENLYIVNKNGANLRGIFRQDSFAEFKISNLRWSPNGQYIAFNANYGPPTPDSDKIQKVQIISVHSKKVLDPSNSDKTNRLVDWIDDDELLFLSTYRDMNHSLDFAYEVWKYDLNSAGKTVLFDGPMVKNCRYVELSPDKLTLAYSSFDSQPAHRRQKTIFATRLVSLSLLTGQETLLADSEERSVLSDRFAFADNRRIIFMRDTTLWKVDLGGKPIKLGVECSDEQFTLSPNSSKICFEGNGGLFVVNLAQLQTKKPDQF